MTDDELILLDSIKMELRRRRAELLEEIARCADEIAAIDREIAVIESCELEIDLIRAGSEEAEAL